MHNLTMLQHSVKMDYRDKNRIKLETVKFPINISLAMKTMLTNIKFRNLF